MKPLFVRVIIWLSPVIAAIASTSCVASSSMGRAFVLDKAGVPCIGVADTSIKFFGLYVSNVDAAVNGSWQALDNMMWRIQVTPAGNFVHLKSGECIAYGDNPANTVTTQESKTLEEGHLYTVFLRANPKRGNANYLGYDGAFCVRRNDGGTLQIVNVPWDAKRNQWNREICTKASSGYSH